MAKIVPLKFDDRRIYDKCAKVTLDELQTSEFQELVNDMLDYVYGRNVKLISSKKSSPVTVGLSASQIGVPKCISIVDLAIGKSDYSDIYVLINPKITWKSTSTIQNREGCASLPNIWGIVERHKRIKIEALDRSGNKLWMDLKGWPAVLLQHEIDHLDGHLFIDHLKDPTRAHFVKEDEMAEYRKNYKTWKKFIDVSDILRK